jgi:ankyrin repeat protein
MDHGRFRRIDAAFKAGDLEALRAAVDDPALIPNGPMPIEIGPCLVYAIYWSPFAFIRRLLEIGADPNHDDHDGFPPLIAALTKTRDQPGSMKRDDVLEVVALLLEHGADPNQRGINDYTPLHMAVAERNARAIDVLLAAGADPRLETRIDECETPLEMARKAGCTEIAARLAAQEKGRG